MVGIVVQAPFRGSGRLVLTGSMESVLKAEMGATLPPTRHEAGLRRGERGAMCWRVTRKGTWSAGGLRNGEVRPKGGSRAMQKKARSRLARRAVTVQFRKKMPCL